MRKIVLAAAALSLAAITGAQAAEQPKPSAAAAPGDKMICKRFTRIGTLAGSYKTCKTKSEWDREHSNIRTAGYGSYCGPRETAGGMSTQSC
jgi:hypothetical protein